MQERPLFTVKRPLLICILLVLTVYWVSAGSSDVNASEFTYKVQEDPYFTFGYPAGMILNVTADNGRNTYHLHTFKTPAVRLMVTSMENPEWLVLPKDALVTYESSFGRMFLNNTSQNVTFGPGLFNQDENTSSYFTSYLDPDAKELAFSYVISSSDDIIYGMLREPAGLYHSAYGDFALKSLFSIQPRMHEKFTYVPVDMTVDLDDALDELSNGPVTKDFVYDPYSGLFMDTDTGYYYIPNLGVFFDPKTNTFHYPSEFGTYDGNFFKTYLGNYSPNGMGMNGFYDGLYTGYDATSTIQDVYQNRQNVYDAANAMWTDYIRDNQYYAVDDSGYAEPIDTIQEYQDYGLS